MKTEQRNCMSADPDDNGSQTNNVHSFNKR